MWGALVAIGGEYGANRQVAQTAFEAQVGRMDTFERVYYNWDEGWPSAWDYWSRDQGRQLMISWNTRRRDGTFPRWKDIARGQYNADIDRVAAALKDFGAPIYFVFHHEPDNDPDIGTPEEFVAAYQYIHDRFISDGVTNVAYVLTLMAYTFRVGAADQWYPGDDYVDYLAADGYNWYGCEGRDDPWREFDWIFQDFHDFGQAHHKPMLVGEYASGEDPLIPGRKALWLANASITLKTWPDVKGVAYYNNGMADPNCDRWVDSSTTALAAFIAMGADPYFNPVTPPAPPGGYDAYVGAQDDVYTAAVGTASQGVTVDFLIQGPYNSHTITDDSSMDWYDSRTLRVNTDWQWTYPAAGNFRLVCTLHAGMSLTLKIPIVVSPLSGRTYTTFKVTWASAKPPTDFVYDVQIQRPDGLWEFWQKSVTTTTANFVPDSGKGTYSFRARMKRSSTGLASLYSDLLPITVS
jgi:plastocyanin